MAISEHDYKVVIKFVYFELDLKFLETILEIQNHDGILATLTRLFMTSSRD